MQGPTRHADDGCDDNTEGGTFEGHLDAFNSHDVDAVMAYFAEDCVLEMPRGPDPWGSRHEGTPAVPTALRSRFDGIPDVHYGDDAHYVAGDTRMSKWTLRGTVAATGQLIKVRGCDFFEFRGGKVVGKDSYWKLVELA